VRQGAPNRDDVCIDCSYDQLVLEHRVDPEEVLTNLGFIKRSTSDVRRLPDHFLLYQTKAKGITCDDYLNDYPEVRQHLEQKLAVENAFRIVNRTPPSPVPTPVEDSSEGQLMDSVGQSKHKSQNDRVCCVEFEGHLKDESRGVKGHLKGDDWNLQGHFDNLTLELNLNHEADNSVSVGSEVYFQGLSTGFQGHLGRADPMRVEMSIVSALLADDRLPLRYIESLMHRLRSGRDANQAALVFDGYGLDWSWKLDSESLSSVWLPSTDLDSLNFLEDSIATDDWSMQPPTADFWSAAPPTTADWSIQLPNACDWPMQQYLFDSDHMWSSKNFPRTCSVLPAFQRPLSGLLSTTTADCSHYQADRQDSDSSDQYHDRKDGCNSGNCERPGEIFCDCCSGRVEHQLSPATKSWDEEETVDFFIDDGAEVIADCCQQLDMQASLQKSRFSGCLCNIDSVVPECHEDVVWNDLLFTRGDLIETLV